MRFHEVVIRKVQFDCCFEILDFFAECQSEAGKALAVSSRCERRPASAASSFAIAERPAGSDKRLIAARAREAPRMSDQARLI